MEQTRVDIAHVIFGHNISAQQPFDFDLHPHIHQRKKATTSN